MSECVCVRVSVYVCGGGGGRELGGGGGYVNPSALLVKINNSHKFIL